MANEINQAIGSIDTFGYLLEDGHNVLEDHIVLGGVRNEDNEVIDTATYCQGEQDFSQWQAEKPWYRVTSAYEKDDLVMVNASLIEE